MIYNRDDYHADYIRFVNKQTLSALVIHQHLTNTLRDKLVGPSCDSPIHQLEELRRYHFGRAYE